MLNSASASYKMRSQTPSLFDTDCFDEPPGDGPGVAGKALIDKLLKVRRSLSPEEQLFGLPRINLLIDELRSLIRATPTQREEMVLYAVERQGATTETEIAEDTRLHRDVVKEIIKSLIQKNILYKISRTVIGSGRPQFAIKSNRVKLPEAD